MLPPCRGGGGGGSGGGGGDGGRGARGGGVDGAARDPVDGAGAGDRPHGGPGARACPQGAPPGAHPGREVRVHCSRPTPSSPPPSSFAHRRPPHGPPALAIPSFPAAPADPLPATFAPACASVLPRDPGHREARAKRPDLVPSRNRARAALAVRLAVLRQAASGKAGKDQEHVLALLEPLLEDKDDWPRLTAEAVKDPSTPYDVEAVLQASAAGKDMLKRLEEALEAAHESLGGLRPAEEKFMANAAAVSKETKHSHFVLRSSVAREEDHGDFRVTGTGL